MSCSGRVYRNATKWRIGACGCDDFAGSCAMPWASEMSPDLPTLVPLWHLSTPWALGARHTACRLQWDFVTAIDSCIPFDRGPFSLHFRRVHWWHAVATLQPKIPQCIPCASLEGSISYICQCPPHVKRCERSTGADCQRGLNTGKSVGAVDTQYF